MAAWFHNVGEPLRPAALRYLLYGDLQREVLERLREKRPSWLREFDEVRRRLDELGAEDWVTQPLLAALFPGHRQDRAIETVKEMPQLIAPRRLRRRVEVVAPGQVEIVLQRALDVADADVEDANANEAEARVPRSTRLLRVVSATTLAAAAALGLALPALSGARLTTWLRALAPLLGGLCHAVSYLWVTPEIEALRELAGGGIGQLPADSPSVDRFAVLHELSQQLYLAAASGALAALIWDLLAPAASRAE